MWEIGELEAKMVVERWGEEVAGMTREEGSQREGEVTSSEAQC